MTVIFTASWPGSNGDAWPAADWSNPTRATVQANLGELASIATAFNGASIEVDAARLAGLGGDYDIVAACVVSDATNTGYFNHHLNSAGGDRYQLTYTLSSDAISLDRYASYSGSGVDSGSVSGGALGDGGTLNYHIRKDGGHITAAFWTGGSEPAPQIDYTDGSPWTGDHIGLELANGGAYIQKITYTSFVLSDLAGGVVARLPYIGISCQP